MAQIETMDFAGVVPVESANSPDALFELGLLYSTGCAVPMDLISAHKWFNLAAWKGCAEAARLRKEVAELMTTDEIAEAQRAARAWMTLH